MRPEPASEQDVSGILRVLAENEGDPSLLWRSEAGIRRALGRFFVVKNGGGEVVGCAAVELGGELVCVAVSRSFQGRGVGASLVKACEGGQGEVWLVTTKPDYYRRLGYASFSPGVFLLVRKFLKGLGQPPRRWPLLLKARFTYMKKRAGAVLPGQPA